MSSQNAMTNPNRRAGGYLIVSLALAAVVLVFMPRIAQAASSLSVDVVASPTAVKAPGGTVTFNVTVTNTGTEALTLTSLTDSVYGNLNGQGTCVTGGTIAVSGTYACSYQAEITGVAGASQTNTVTARATDDAPNEVSDSDSAAVVVTPRLGVGNTASPTNLTPPGGTVTFSVSAVNLGSGPITISAITDSVYGDLSTRGTCTNAVNTVLASEGANYSCSFTANVTQTQTSTVTITATGTGGPFTGSDPATVTVAAAVTTTSTSTTSTTKAPGATTTTAVGSTVGLIVNLSQASGVPGERFTVSGSGWAANELLTITFNSTPKVLATTVVDSGGRFTVNVKVPDDATTGAHTVVVTGQAGRAISRPFTVNAATGTTTAGGTTTTIRSGALARTGMSSGDFAVLATMALMLGAAAVAASPRGRLAWSTRRRVSKP